MTNTQAQMQVNPEVFGSLDVYMVKHEIQEVLATLRRLETTFDMYVRGNATEAMSTETFAEMRAVVLAFWEAIKQDEKDRKNDKTKKLS